MGYQNYKAEDFIQDDRFINWVRSGAEQSFWQKWIQDNPEQETELLEARKLLEKLSFETQSLSPEGKSRMLANIQANRDTSELLTSQRKSIRPLWILGAAAAVLLLLFLFLQPDSEKEVQHFYQTAYEESSIIDLPDGSQVVLNANSALTIAEDWESSDIREVILKGEAFFSIVSANKAEGKKFRVHAGEMEVEVLGTKFNVEQREEKFRVVLTEGKVKVGKSQDAETPGASIQLKPGEMASFDFSDKKLNTKEVNTKVYTSWQSEELFFDRTPLPELLDILRYSYGYEVQIGDESILSKKLSGTLPNGDPETLLKGLSSAFSIDIQILGEKRISLQARN